MVISDDFSEIFTMKKHLFHGNVWNLFNENNKSKLYTLDISTQQTARRTSELTSPKKNDSSGDFS